MSKHTPGPWSVGEERYGYDCIIRGPKNEPIAATQMAGYTKREARLNAKLIAAAPHMFEILERLCNETASDRPPSCKVCDDARELVGRLNGSLP